MIGESAAHVGTELAEQIRLGHSGVSLDFDEICLMLDRLAYSKATTTRDILALIVMARHIINSCPAPEGTPEAMVQQMIQQLQVKAIEALEPLAKERAAAYQGYEFN